jgi:hypothetical protein
LSGDFIAVHPGQADIEKDHFGEKLGGFIAGNSDEFAMKLEGLVQAITLID